MSQYLFSTHSAQRSTTELSLYDHHYLISGHLSEMPHFAQAELSSQYAHTDSLSFMHYLKAGRPSYAFLVFLASELSGSASLSNSRSAILSPIQSG